MSTNSTSVNEQPKFSRLAGLRKASLSWEVVVDNLISLLFGLGWAVTAAVLIAQQEWMLLFGLVLIVPVVMLFFTFPFASVMAWLLLFPFFLQEFMPGSRMIYWLLHRAMIPAALGVVVLRSILGLRKTRAARFGLVDLVMLAFLALSFINILLLTDKPVTELIKFYDRMVIPFGVYWLFRLLSPGERELRWLAPIALVIILTQGVVGLLSWFAPGVLPAAWLSRLGDRTVGTFGNPAVLSTTLVFCAMLLLQAAQLSRSFLERFVLLSAVGAAFFFVFFTFSRGSWLGALFVLNGLVFLYPKSILRLSIAGTLAAALLLTVTPLSSYVEFARNRLFTQTTAENRIVGNAATMRMIEARPIQGWGYGNHELYDEQFRGRILGLEVKDNENSSHNTYLLITAEMGLPGLLLYLFPAAWLLLLSIRNWKRLPQEGMMSRSMLFMLWLLLADHFIVGNFTDLVRSNLFSTVVWWMALAWIANIVESARTAQVVRR